MNADPWINSRNLSTGSYELYSACVKTGNIDSTGKPFVVHASDGSGLACGILRLHNDEKETSTGYDTRQNISWTIMAIGIVTVLYAIIV